MGFRSWSVNTILLLTIHAAIVAARVTTPLCLTFRWANGARDVAYDDDQWVWWDVVAVPAPIMTSSLSSSCHLVMLCDEQTWFPRIAVSIQSIPHHLANKFHHLKWQTYAFFVFVLRHCIVLLSLLLVLRFFALSNQFSVLLSHHSFSLSL